MTTTSQNETLYALFERSYTLAAAYAAWIADEVEAAHEDAPDTIRETEFATVAPRGGK